MQAITMELPLTRDQVQAMIDQAVANLAGARGDP